MIAINGCPQADGGGTAIDGNWTAILKIYAYRLFTMSD